jgi:hypothetical protein
MYHYQQRQSTCGITAKQLLKKTFQTKEMKFSDALSLPRMNILQPDASCKSKTQTKLIIWRAFFNWIYQLIQLVEMSTRACKRL